MKNSLRKWDSMERRDLWDGPRQYLLSHLPVDKLKHKLRHVSRKDRKMKPVLEQALAWRMHRE